MPFTPCHIAAVIPLRRRLPLLGLAIGAMIPDFGYYFAPTPYFVESAHTITRSLTFCLPVGIAVWVLLVLTRTGWQRVLPFELPRVQWGFAFALKSLVAIWIGALTHIFWDAWTHANGYFVELWPGIPYKTLQHLSTAIGFLILAPLLYRNMRPWKTWSPLVLRFWAIVAALAGAFVYFKFSSGMASTPAHPKFYFHLLTGYLAMAFVLAFLGAAGMSVRPRTD